MENFNLAQLLTILGVMIAGIFAAFSLIDKGIRERSKTKDELDDKIRSLLQEENKELADKVNNLTNKIELISKKQIEIESENKILKAIFQGRDDDALKYREEGRETFKLAKDVAKMIVTNGKKTDAIIAGMATQNKNIERLAKALEKHIANIDGR